MADPLIVVTNDDGIDSPGLGRLAEALGDLGEVTVVAPATNQSAVGRAIDSTAKIETHPRGVAVHGSPSTCVVAATTALALDPDVVVSGINKGANLGTSILGRSGTIGAAIEAAYLGYPAIALSANVPFERIQGEFSDFSPDPAEYDPAVAVARYLVEQSLNGALPDDIDYLNVNTPLSDDLRDPRIRVTEPAGGYHTEAVRDGEQLTLRDRQFELLYTGDLATDGLNDRAVIAEGQVSVSPLRLPTQPAPSSLRSSLADQLFSDELSSTILTSD